jgi:uncharacterized cupredoxin-like copper-binding protein
MAGDDFSFTVDSTRAASGTVHFRLKNESKTYQHELWVYPKEQPKLSAMLAQKDSGEAHETDFISGIAGRIRALDPGATGTADIVLPKGTYEYACFVTTAINGKNQVHYELGMHGTLTVR